MAAAAWGDLVAGVNLQVVMVPTPGGPVPVPMQHPCLGLVIDLVGTAVGASGLWSIRRKSSVRASSWNGADASTFGLRTWSLSLPAPDPLRPEREVEVDRAALAAGLGGLTRHYRDAGMTLCQRDPSFGMEAAAVGSGGLPKTAHLERRTGHDPRHDLRILVGRARELERRHEHLLAGLLGWGTESYAKNRKLDRRSAQGGRQFRPDHQFGGTLGGEPTQGFGGNGDLPPQMDAVFAGRQEQQRYKQKRTHHLQKVCAPVAIVACRRCGDSIVLLWLTLSLRFVCVLLCGRVWCVMTINTVDVPVFGHGSANCAIITGQRTVITCCYLWLQHIPSSSAGNRGKRQAALLGACLRTPGISATFNGAEPESSEST
jgi:hypothetical protein